MQLTVTPTPLAWTPDSVNTHRYVSRTTDIGGDTRSLAVSCIELAPVLGKALLLNAESHASSTH